VTAAIAAVGVAGLLALALATGTGSAPGSGQKVFDAPGCLPKSYDGPGHAPHYMLNRNCPTPQPVIVHAVTPKGDGWLVSWDGSRSYDPMGGKLVDYEWKFDDALTRHGAETSVFFPRPGPHSVVLYVTNDSKLTGTARQIVRVP
jgi:hypothetical protein